MSIDDKQSSKTSGEAIMIIHLCEATFLSLIEVKSNVSNNVAAWTRLQSLQNVTLADLD